MKFVFATQSARDKDNAWASTGRLINCYREPIGDRVVVRSHLGTEAFGTIAGSGTYSNDDATGPFAVDFPPAAMWGFGSELVAVHPDGVHVFNGSGTIENEYAFSGISGYTNATQSVTEIDGVGWGYNVAMAENNGRVTIAAFNELLTYSGDTPVAVTSGAFSPVSSCFTFNSLTVATERGGRRVKWSDVGDPTNFPALNFATKEGREDNIVRGIAVNDTIVIFGEKSTEYWWQNGAGDLARRGSVIEDTGLHSFGACALGRNTLFYVATDGIAYITAGQGKQRVSTVAVESTIARAQFIQCTYWEENGHKFFALITPTEPAWILNLATMEWSERVDGNDLDGNWSGFCTAEWRGEYYLGVSDAIQRLTRNNKDVAGKMTRRIVSKTVEQGGDRFKIPKLELRGNFGDMVSVHTATLRMSEDFAESWRYSKTQCLGTKAGNRPVFRALGQYRQATAEITYDADEDIILDAEVIV